MDAAATLSIVKAGSGRNETVPDGPADRGSARPLSSR